MGVVSIQSFINQRLLNVCGSRRGCIRNYWHRLLYFTRFYQDYRKVDWTSVERLVFVCKGNICRSAFAEVVAKSEGVNAISCGLDTIEAAPANKNAIRTAGKMGYNLEEHRTTPITSLAFSEHDLFIAMEPWQTEHLKAHFQGINHCTLLGLWKRPVRPYIHDPYSATNKYFENCFEYIEKSVHEITGKIKTERD